MADLSVRIGSLTLRNPFLAASGCFGYGVEYADAIDLSSLGGVVSKGLFLKAREGEAGLHEWAEQNYRAGDRVRVAEGAFRGYEGILLARTSRERVVVLLDILGRQVRTKVEVSQLERG